MKIKISGQRVTHYQAMCHVCDWTMNDHHDRESVRRAVKIHIRQTGHSMSIEKGTSVLYEAAEPALAGGRFATRRTNGQ